MSDQETETPLEPLERGPFTVFNAAGEEVAGDDLYTGPLPPQLRLLANGIGGYITDRNGTVVHRAPTIEGGSGE